MTEHAILLKEVCVLFRRCGGTAQGSGDFNASHIDAGTRGADCHTRSVLLVHKAAEQTVEDLHTGNKITPFTVNSPSKGRDKIF